MKRHTFKWVAVAILFASTGTSTGYAQTAWNPGHWTYQVRRFHSLISLVGSDSQTEQYSFIGRRFRWPELVPPDIRGLTRRHLMFWWGGYFDPTETFASGGSANGGIIYHYDPIGNTYYALGASGFASVPAIAYGAVFGSGGVPSLYGAAAVTGDVSDRLIEINLGSGLGTTIGLFGSWSGLQIRDIEGMFMTWGGYLYGSTGFEFDGTPGDIFEIDPTTGAATLRYSLEETGTGASLENELTGLTYSPYNGVVGCLGEGTPAFRGRLIVLDWNAGTFSYMNHSAPPTAWADVAW